MKKATKKRKKNVVLDAFSRQEVYNKSQKGYSLEKLAKMYDISTGTVRNILRDTRLQNMQSTATEVSEEWALTEPSIESHKASSVEESWTMWVDAELLSIAKSLRSIEDRQTSQLQLTGGLGIVLVGLVCMLITTAVIYLK